MYEISREYLDRLLKESGVKLGGAKASAMVALIERLDTNALNGLLASIKEDYAAMLEATKKLSSLQQDVQEYNSRIRQLQHTIGTLRTQAQQLESRIKSLKDEEQTAQFEAELRGCREEERSRLVAYEAAIRIGKGAFSGSVSSDVMAQILRSASNVAAGFVPVSTVNVEETIDNQPSRDKRRSIL